MGKQFLSFSNVVNMVSSFVPGLMLALWSYRHGLMGFCVFGAVCAVAMVVLSMCGLKTDNRRYSLASIGIGVCVLLALVYVTMLR
ncbi:hypothetical protein [uncultured Megasphaera sp.]|uniref:hypothetical protein n=1 Tax=uncultured Megasphaera sp. TaxID=165188 RepID=UPI00265A74C1|nr:hypothetical protein [uncultured Megasphaera sp.]